MFYSFSFPYTFCNSTNDMVVSSRYYACLCGHHELVEFLLQNGEVVLIANRFNTGFVTARALSKRRRMRTSHADTGLTECELSMRIIADVGKLDAKQPSDVVFSPKIYESYFSSAKHKLKYFMPFCFFLSIYKGSVNGDYNRKKAFIFFRNSLQYITGG